MKKIFSLLFISTVILFVASTPEIYGGQEDQAVLEKLDLLQSEVSLKAVIGVSGEFSYQHFELKDPSRLVVEISPVGEIRAQESYDINAFGVKAVRTGRFKPDTARIVFDLVEALPSYEIIQVANGIEVVFRIAESVDRVPSVTERKVEAEERETVPAEKVKSESHLKSVSYGKLNGQLKVDIRIDGDFTYRAVEFHRDLQLILDFWPIHILSAESLKGINISGLRDISVKKTEPETAQVIFDFSGIFSSFKIENREDGIRIYFTSDQKPLEEVREEAKQVEKIIFPPLENTMISFTGAGYSVSDSDFNWIYGDMAAMYGVELTRILVKRHNSHFALTLGANYFLAKGSSTLTEEDSEFTIIPYSLAGEYLWNLENFVPFFRLGVDLITYKEKSDYHEVSGNTFGTHFIVGLYFKIPNLEQLKIKFFCKLVSATAEEGGMSIDLGGIEAGFGITFGFNVL